MVYHKLVLSDGTEIRSDKIMSTSFTSSVTDSQDIEPGAICTSELEITLWGKAGSEQIANGSMLQFYTVTPDGVETLIATLTTEKPTRASANTYKVIAYDYVTKLDVDLTDWLLSLTDSFPMSMQSFVELVCSHCGLSLYNSFIPGGDYVIQAFSLSGVTGRELLQWAAQIGGQFVRATPRGQIEFAWYVENNDVTIDHEPINATSVVYYSGSLSYEDYVVAPVEKVQIRQDEDDTGTIYPTDQESGNTYVLEGNCLLSSDSSSNILPVAQTLYQRMMAMEYVPMRVEIPYTGKVKVGDIVKITDSNGVTFTTYITNCVANGNTMSLESVGNPYRDSVSAVNSRTFSNLKGRVFNLSISVDGLKTKAEDLEGAYSELSQTVEGMTSTVADAEKNITQLMQDAGQVKVTAASEQGTLSTIISNDGTWKSEYVDANGRVLSGIYFDFLAKSFVFNGSGSFTGELNIGNGNFIVDVNGNVTAMGDTKIYGGKYYAMDDDGTGNYTTMDEDGFSVYSSDAVQRVKVGFPAYHPECPFVVLNGGTVDSASRIIMKQFTDGMWLGNDAPMSKYGEFSPASGYNGIFVSLTDGQTYVVSGTNMQSVYTGEAIAKFG